MTFFKTIIKSVLNYGRAGLSVLLTGCLALSVSLAVPSSADAKKVKVKACTVAPEGTPWEQLTKVIKKRLRKASGGNFKLKIYMLLSHAFLEILALYRLITFNIVIF